MTPKPVGWMRHWNYRGTIAGCLLYLSCGDLVLCFGTKSLMDKDPYVTGWGSVVDEDDARWHDEKDGCHPLWTE